MMYGSVVRVFENWQADSFDVFVFPADAMREGTLPTMIHRHVEGDLWRLEEVGENESFSGRPKPSFSVPAPVLEEVVRAVTKAKPSLDRDDAVADARQTRDRLLDLVEKTVESWTRQP